MMQKFMNLNRANVDLSVVVRQVEKQTTRMSTGVGNIIIKNNNSQRESSLISPVHGTSLRRPRPHTGRSFSNAHVRIRLHPGRSNRTALRLTVRLQSELHRPNSRGPETQPSIESSNFDIILNIIVSN